MKHLAAGRLAGDAVIVDDERAAQRLEAKGSVGQPVSGGGLRLSRIEAAHAVHAGRLVVTAHGDAGAHDVPSGTIGTGSPGTADTNGTERLDWTRLCAGSEVAYFAYADLRDRGLVVRHDQGAFLAWPRGGGPPGPAWFRFHAASERDAVDPEALLAWARDEAVVGLVDEDGSVTHYRLRTAAPRGEVQVPERTLGAGILLEDRVVVPGAGKQGGAWLGMPHGDDLVLSFTEAETLRRRGLLDVPPLDDLAPRKQHHFLRTLPVYEALREAGVVAKSGFRFGTHLRGYARDPAASHADWLLQCAHPTDALHWSELSRGVRLAHGVRKTFLLAVTDPVRFVGIEWFRP